MRDVDAFPMRDGEVSPFATELGLAGVADIHTHAMPDRLQAAVWRYFDALTEPPWPITYRGDLDERLATLRSLGVRRHTALAYAHQPGMLAWLNDFTLDLADRHQQVIPTFTIYPEDGVGEEVERCLARGGQVVKVHLQVSRFHADDPRLDEAWSQLQTARTPIVIHASAVYGVDGGAEYCGADGLRRLLERFPDLRLVVAHLGMPQFEEFLVLAEQVPSVLMDTAMIPCDPPYAGVAYPEEHLDRLRAIADQLVFGSDYPSIPHAYAAQVRGLAVLQLDDGGLRALLHDRLDALLEGVQRGGEA